MTNTSSIIPILPRYGNLTLFQNQQKGLSRRNLQTIPRPAQKTNLHKFHHPVILKRPKSLTRPNHSATLMQQWYIILIKGNDGDE